MSKGYEIRAPYEKERAELFNIFYVCFPHAVNGFKQLEKNNRPLSDYLYGYEPRVMLMDGKIIANVSLVRYKIYLGGKVVPIGGIASVVTLPEYQRKGYAQMLLQERFRNMQEEGTYLSILMTELPWAYETMGFKIVPQDYRVVDLAEQKNNTVDPHIALTEDIAAANVIMPLYDEIAPTLDGAIKREPSYWQDYYFDGLTGMAGNGGPLLLYKDGGKLLGYARIHEESDRVLLSETVAKDWNPDILQKLVKAAMKTAVDKGFSKMVIGMQENHPLRKQLAAMGVKHKVERPEGMREVTMLNVLAKLP